MTAEELIIEHFDGTLSLEQEGELTQVLASSPEARATYDRYLRVNEVLADDVVATAPSSALDERVMAAALGAIGGTIGGGSATWISGKIAAMFTVVAVGGLSLFLFLPKDADPVRSETPPPASTTPTPTKAPAPVIPVPTPATVESGETTATENQRTTESNRPKRTGERSTATNGSRTNTAKPGNNSATRPSMTLNPGNATTIDDGKVKIDPEKDK